MPTEILEKHEIAGLDERARGFNRMVGVERADGRLRAFLRYEVLHLETDGGQTVGDTVRRLVALLHARGFTQLRTRVSFRGGTYLGSQEPWVEYPDPESSGRWTDRLFRFLRIG